MDTTDSSDPNPASGDATEGPPRKKSWLEQKGLVLEPGPSRVLVNATFVNVIGGGMFKVSAALFYTKSVGLPVTQVGLGLGIAAMVGLLSGIPVGHIADRRGPRETYLVTLTIQALVMASLVLIQSFWFFVVAICLTELAQSASQAARGPIVRTFGGKKAVRFRAYLRSAVNLAGSIGALLAAFAIQLDTRGAYIALILGNAASFLVCALMVTRLPKLDPVPAKPGANRRGALRDYPFVAVTVLDGLMSIQFKVLSFALPLWIVDHTNAPRWFVGVSVLVNTGMVVALQVKASKGVDSNTAAARVWRRSGLAFLVGMGLIGLAGGVPGWLAVVIIAVGVAVHTFGELWQAAGSFELRYNLAPAHAQGQYSGLFGLGSSLSSVIAPTVLALLCIAWGAPGWWVMGGIFVLLGLFMPSVVRWAERTRPAEVEVVEPAPAG